MRVRTLQSYDVRKLADRRSQILIVRLQGGLGNQLFQYAAGLEASRKKSALMKLDMTVYGLPRERSDHDAGARAPDILDFNIDANIASREEVKRASRVPFGLVGEKLRQFKYKYLVHYYVGHKAGLLVPDRGGYMDGYFQTERSFEGVAARVRREFTLKTALEASMRASSDVVEGLGQTVSVHIRRGDFVASEHNRRILDLCGPDYYRNAMAELAGAVGSFTPVVFSDDPSWARENVRFDTAPVFAADLSLANGSPLSAGQELVIMSRCTHHIIANSTFSWWGAYLNSSQNKIVVAPSIWARGQKGYQDVLPAEWRRVAVA